MTKRLSNEDREAVDLLLDRTLIGADGNGGSFMSHAKTSPQARLRSVDGVLRVLDALPAPEPAADLVERTMQRIASEALSMPADSARAPIPLGDAGRPHA